MANCGLGKQSKKKLETAQSSNSAKSRIQDLSADTEK
jgi:hypothetical protein